MANILSKTGIIPGTVVQASYVSQSIDAFTGIVPYNLSLNGNFNLIGVLDTTAIAGGNGGSLTGSLSSTSSFAITSFYTNTIITPTSWSLYATSASYSEGVLVNNIPVSQVSSSQPNVIIAGTGTILTDTNTFQLKSSFFEGKTLNNNVWVTLLQRAPYPSDTPFFGSTYVIPLDLTGNTLTFSVLSGNASSDLTFDFIITVQR
jgi:hypothetical protein